MRQPVVQSRRREKGCSCLEGQLALAVSWTSDKPQFLLLSSWLQTAWLPDSVSNANMNVVLA